MHAIKKVKNWTYVEIQNDFLNMFIFYDSSCSLWNRAYIDVCYGCTHPEKNVQTRMYKPISCKNLSIEHKTHKLVQIVQIAHNPVASAGNFFYIAFNVCAVLADMAISSLITHF